MSGALAFAQSMLIGLSIAAPVGPIGLLVIQRTLQQGRAVGLATGLGAAAADAVYGAVGAFGVAWLIASLANARRPLAVVGGAFLLWLAWRTWSATPAAQAAEAGAGGGLLPAFAGSFLLTLSNPATILSFVAVFGVLAGQGAPVSPWSMIAGVGLGSALWWLLLTAAVSRLHAHLDTRARRWVNRVSAGLLAGFALWQWGAAAAG
jgi:threonine/homoserine/homoserine lactone efflux protein